MPVISDVRGEERFVPVDMWRQIRSTRICLNADSFISGGHHVVGGVSRVTHGVVASAVVNASGHIELCTELAGEVVNA